MQGVKRIPQGGSVPTGVDERISTLDAYQSSFNDTSHARVAKQATGAES